MTQCTGKIIAHQGVAGAFSHQACCEAYPDFTPLSAPTFRQAIELVETGQAQLAMIPLENSTAGRVEEIYRLLPSNRLFIQAEHFQPIRHNLLGLPGTQLDQLRTVTSHPQALAQCAEHIEQLGLESIAGLNTAAAAKAVSQANDPTQAAIASQVCAELYGLEVLQSPFEDRPGNTTRFLVLSADPSLPTLSEQRFISSLYFQVRNIPAALYKALGGFATNEINMVKLESYNHPDSLTASSFHLDIEGHPDQPGFKHAMEELRFFAKEVRLLGCYPAHPLRH